MIIKLLNGDLIDLPKRENETSPIPVRRIVEMSGLGKCPRNFEAMVTNLDSLTRVIDYVYSPYPEFVSVVFVPTPPRAQVHYIMVPRDTALTQTTLPGLLWGDLAVAIDVYAAIEHCSSGNSYIFDGEKWLPIVNNIIPNTFQVLQNHPTEGFKIPLGYWSTVLPQLVECFTPSANTRMNVVRNLNTQLLQSSFEFESKTYLIVFDFHPFQFRLDDEVTQTVAPYLLSYLSVAPVYHVRHGSNDLEMKVDVFTLSLG